MFRVKITTFCWHVLLLSVYYIGVSISPHADGFILKGAHLFAIWSGVLHRSTRDLDLLCEGDPAIPAVESIFRTVANLSPEPDDGIIFNADMVRGEEIREEARYAGVRVQVDYHIARARGKVQVDVGFGDAVTPSPNLMTFPVLLDFPPPQLRAYPCETVVAEKLEAMVILGIRNSRMKDFYDLYVISQLFHFDGELLRQAIEATFHRRQTLLPADPPLALEPEFAIDILKRTQWSAFLRKGTLAVKVISLGEVIEQLRLFLLPPLRSAALNQLFHAAWVPGSGWGQTEFSSYTST